MTDKSQLRAFMQNIDLDTEAQELLCRLEMSSQEYARWKNLLLTDEQTFFQEINQTADGKLKLLYIYVRCGMDMHESYQSEGVPDEVFFHTFHDISIWSSWAKRYLGDYTMAEAPWFTRLFHMKLFRFGALEFERAQADRAFTWSGGHIDEGQQVIGVHIPEGGPLDPLSCDESFAAAEKFFGPEYALYTCDSWLTSPVVLNLVSPQSNIYQFQKRFEIVDITYPFPLAEQRVWGTVEADKNRYPENTSLQKNLKHYLLKGGRVGMGLGVMARPALEV
ncbi:MAG: acyltransferase domain-containing protein [Atopobiaceae bacterium]